MLENFRNFNFVEYIINYSNRLPHFVAFTYRTHTTFNIQTKTQNKKTKTTRLQLPVQHTTQHRRSIIIWYCRSYFILHPLVVHGCTLFLVHVWLLFIKPYSQRISATNKHKLYKTCPNTRKDRYKNGIPTFECRCGIFQFCPSQETRPRRIAPAPSWFHFKQYE